MKTLWTMATLALALALGTRILEARNTIGFDGIDFTTPLETASNRLSNRAGFTRLAAADGRRVRLAYETRLAGQLHGVTLDYVDGSLDTIELTPHLNGPSPLSGSGCRAAARTEQDALAMLLGEPDRRESGVEADTHFLRARWSYGDGRIESGGRWRPGETDCQVVTAFQAQSQDG